MPDRDTSVRTSTGLPRCPPFVAPYTTDTVLTLTGLVRYLVLFVIDLQTRRVQIGGVVRQAYGAWMAQVARNLTDGVDGFLIGKRYLLHDRDCHVPLHEDGAPGSSVRRRLQDGDYPGLDDVLIHGEQREPVAPGCCGNDLVDGVGMEPSA